MKTRQRNLRPLLALLREFGVTSYRYEGIELTMAPSRAPLADAQPAVATTKVERTSGLAQAKAMMDRAGLDDETAADLAASLGMRD